MNAVEPTFFGEVETKLGVDDKIFRQQVTCKSISPPVPYEMEDYFGVPM